MQVNVPNLKNNIQSTLDEFKIADFIKLNEATDYLGTLPGIKDIVLVSEGLLNTLKGFADQVMKIINSVMEFLNINSILDALGLNKLKDFIFGLVAGVFGSGSLANRELLKRTFDEGCINFNSEMFNRYGRQVPNIQSFALTSILMAMICMGISEAYSAMYGMFSKSVTVEENEIAPHNMTQNDVDYLFGKVVSPMLLKTSGKNAISTLTDITNNTKPASLAVRTSPFIAQQAMSFYEQNEIRYKQPVTAFNSFKNSLGILDPNYNKIDGNFNIGAVKNNTGFIDLGAKLGLNRVTLPDFNTASYSSQNLPSEILNQLV